MGVMGADEKNALKTVNSGTECTSWACFNFPVEIAHH
jgi:hypothetical protein